MPKHFTAVKWWYSLLGGAFLIGVNTRKLLLLIGVLLVLSSAFLFVFEVDASLTSGIARIMPLGDSITSGYPDYEGYRKNLYLDLNDSGFNVDFVGSQNNGVGFDNDHEGYSGETADFIRDNVYGWLEVNPADGVLLHIGTNDIGDGQDVAGIVAEVEGILNNIDQWEFNYNKSVTVILARIILRSDSVIWNTTTKVYNDELEAMALVRIASGDRLIIVDMENALIYPDDLVQVGIYSGIHPTPVGYAKMADAWYNVLVKVLVDHSLTVNYVGNGVVTKLPNQANYTYRSEVELTADADEGWTFSNWSGDLVSSINPENITMDDNKTVTATFTQNEYTLTVTVDPLGAGSILANKTGPYHYGDVVTLTPTANPHYTFSSWSGDGSTGVGDIRVVTVTGNMTVNATFTHNQYKLTVTANLGTTTPPMGDHLYEAGTSVNVESSPPLAGAGVRYVFSSWSGTGSVPASGIAPAVTFTINTPSSITWTWKTQYYLSVSSDYGSVGGAGWHDAGSSVYATITPTTVSGTAGTQYVFTGWSGGASGISSYSNVIVMDGPKTATANWLAKPSTTPTPTPTATPVLTPSPTVSPSPSQSPFGVNISTIYGYALVVGAVLAGVIAGVMVFRRIEKRKP